MKFTKKNQAVKKKTQWHLELIYIVAFNKLIPGVTMFQPPLEILIRDFLSKYDKLTGSTRMSNDEILKSRKVDS